MAFNPQVANAIVRPDYGSHLVNYQAHVNPKYEQIPSSFAFAGKLQQPDTSHEFWGAMQPGMALPNQPEDRFLLRPPYDASDKFLLLPEFYERKQIAPQLRRTRVWRQSTALAGLQPGVHSNGSYLRSTGHKGLMLPIEAQQRIIDPEFGDRSYANSGWPHRVGSEKRVAPNAPDAQIYAPGY